MCLKLCHAKCSNTVPNFDSYILYNSVVLYSTQNTS